MQIDPTTSLIASVVTTTVTSAGKWAWDKWGAEAAKAAGAGAKSQFEQWRKNKGWENAAQDYRRHLINEYSSTKLIGKANPVPIFDSFVLHMLEKPTAMRLYGYQDLRQDPDQLWRDEKRENALQLLNQTSKSHRLVILGKPGAGKSTFLKYLTIRDCRADSDITPILLILREWARSSQQKDSPTPLTLQDLMAFIAQQFDTCGFPDAQAFIEALLRSGSCIVMFDGLDEVNLEGQQRDTVIATVGEFARKYADVQVLMTSRTAALSSLRLDRFNFVELADLNETQQADFAQKWFEGNPELHTQFTTTFAKPEHKSVRQLAGTPLLLSLICLSFEIDKKLSSRKHEVYRKAMEQLLVEWDGWRGILRDPWHPLLQDFDRKTQLFSQLAFEMFCEGDILLEKHDLRERIGNYVRRLQTTNTPSQTLDTNALLDKIESQTGIVIERAHQICGFAHLSLQEYFAARYVRENAKMRTLQMLLQPANLTDDRWHEVLSMTSSMLGDAEDLCLVWLDNAEKLIANHTIIHHLLAWAQQKSTQPAQIGLYMFLALIRDYTRKVELALDYSRIIDLNLTVYFNHGPPLINILILIQILDSTLQFGYSASLCIPLIPLNIRVRALDKALNQSRTLDLRRDWLANLVYLCIRLQINFEKKESRDTYISHVSEVFERLVEACQQTGKDAIAQALQNLGKPDATWDMDEFEAFAKQLQTILQTQLDIAREWRLTEKQHNALVKYLQATQSLVTNLPNMNLRPESRAEIEARLLRPRR